MNKTFPIIGAALAAIVGLTVIGGSWYTVSDGYRGVLTRNSAVIGVAEPGLGFKMPIIDGVRDVSVQPQSKQYVDLPAYSRDQQTAILAISVNYRIPISEVENLVKNYGSVEGVLSREVDRKVNEEVRKVFGQFNAVSAIQERGRLSATMMEAIIKNVTGPVIIDSVQIENIDFSDAYEDSIEKRMLAEVAVQTKMQDAEREKVEAEIAVIKAQGAADSTLAQARATAEGIRIRGEAEADAIKARGAALRDNPALVSLVQAEKWNGALPATMVPGGAVPFVNVGQ